MHTEFLPDPLPGDPLALVAQWLAEATRARVQPNPNAMVLATVDAHGAPSARVVLCKDIRPDPGTITFFTNYLSRKGSELAANARAAVVMHWDVLRRQVRLEGRVTPTTAAESDAYFASRPRGSQIGAWASQQSRPLPSRADLEAAVETYERRFGSGDVPRPDYWRGYRLAPVEIEFWRDRRSRLHDRVMFRRATPGAIWEKSRLYP